MRRLFPRKVGKAVKDSSLSAVSPPLDNVNVIYMERLGILVSTTLQISKIADLVNLVLELFREQRSTLTLSSNSAQLTPILSIAVSYG